MNRRQVKMVAWLMVASLIAAVVATLVSSLGDDDAPSVTSPSSLASDVPTALPADAGVQLPAGPHVIAYLCTGEDCPVPTPADVGVVERSLAADTRVASYEYVPADAAYALFLQQFADNQDFVESIDESDVPAFFTIDVYEATAIPAVITDLNGLPGVGVAVDNLSPS